MCPQQRVRPIRQPGRSVRPRGHIMNDINQPSRRDLLAAAGLAALPFAAGAQPPAPGGTPPPAGPGSDFTLKSAALEADKIVLSACQFCNSLCGLKVHLK